MTELKVLVILMSSFHCKYLMQTWFFSSKKIQFSLRKIIWRSIDFGTYLKSSLYKFILFIANILCKPVSIPLFSWKKIRFSLEIVITCYVLNLKKKKKVTFTIVSIFPELKGFFFYFRRYPAVLLMIWWSWISDIFEKKSQVKSTLGNRKSFLKMVSFPWPFPGCWNYFYIFP